MTIVNLSYKQTLFLKRSFVDYLDLDWKEFTVRAGGDCTGKEFIVKATKLPDATRLNIEVVVLSKNFNMYNPANKEARDFFQSYSEKILPNDNNDYYFTRWLKNNIDSPELIRLKEHMLSDKFKQEFKDYDDLITIKKQRLKEKNIVRFNAADQYNVASVLAEYLKENSAYGFLIRLIYEAQAKNYCKTIKTSNADTTGTQLIESIKALFGDQDGKKLIEYLSLSENDNARRFAVVLDQDFTTAGLFDKSEDIRLAAKKKIKDKEIA